MMKRPGPEKIDEGKYRFHVWAPLADHVEVIFKDDKEPQKLGQKEFGNWEAEIEGLTPETQYKFRLDKSRDKEFPDPASRYQPEGVHSWSQLVDQEQFKWSDDNWKGIPISEMIIYEIHVGTFTKEGTFEAIIEKLDYLKELGINAIEIMPISQFPGNRNWGYDGVYPYAAQAGYGGPAGLKKMIDACHKDGIAVILDAVYNHMGPEGNYLSQFGPYFTEKYKTPWGSALNFDDKHSDHVREFFLQNALMWLDDYHFDGLRLDAIHEIIDRGAHHFLKELSLRTDELEKRSGRSKVLIAESDLNDTKIINPYEKGGFGIEAQWVDDFHHSLHTLLTEEKGGYYLDFGTINHLAKSYKQAFIYDGIYSEFRKRKVGNSPQGLPPSKFVICIQNHDQVGNRMLGERLSELVSFEALKLAAGVVLTAPFVPMLFMGEEFGEDQPFQYFVSHGDPDLVKAVQEGRRREFEYFFEVGGDFPDPQSEETFNNSKLNWDFKKNKQKNAIFNFYRELINLRKGGLLEALRNSEIATGADEKNQVLKVTAMGVKNYFLAFNFGSDSQKISMPFSFESFKIILASADKKWNGEHEFPGSSNSSEKLTLPGKSLIICEN